jgi:hypothetical protein
MGIATVIVVEIMVENQDEDRGEFILAARWTT